MYIQKNIKKDSGNGLEMFEKGFWTCLYLVEKDSGRVGEGFLFFEKRF
jgi:hypothetical protein